MIRKLTEDDRAAVIAFLEREPSFNLFLLGDIENFGFRSAFQEVWAEFAGDGGMKAVLLRYYGSFLVYAPDEFDVRGMARIIGRDKRFEALSGRSETVDKFRPLMYIDKAKQMHFAELSGDRLQPMNVNRSRVQKATLADVEAIFALKKQISEFRLAPTAQQSFRQALCSGTGRSYMVKLGDQVVSVASTTAENPRSAMIVGVCTHPEHRKQGYATMCVNALCQEVLQEGRSLCLFYDNPAAGSIYRRIGFRDIGRWTILYAAKGWRRWLI